MSSRPGLSKSPGLIRRSWHLISFSRWLSSPSCESSSLAAALPPPPVLMFVVYETPPVPPSSWPLHDSTRCKKVTK